MVSATVPRVRLPIAETPGRNSLREDGYIWSTVWGVLCTVVWKAGHVKAECPAGKVWAAHLLVAKKQSRGGEEYLHQWTSAFLPFSSIQAPSPLGGASHIQGRSFPFSCCPTSQSSLKTDTPRGCFGNLLGVSQSNQVDSNHQTLVGVSRDKNRMCSLSLSLVTNYQYSLQGIPMASGVVKGTNIY